MKNSFKKYLVGLSVFVLIIGLSCSKRESETVNSNPAASNSYTNAQSTLTALGLAISIPTIGDFADTTGTNTAALTAVFSGNDSKVGFDTTKFAGLESAITDLQTSLAAYTGAPKNNLSLSPSLVVQSWQDSDLAYLHFILGYYYTVHAVLKLRGFVANGIITIQGSRYVLDTNSDVWNNLADSGKQAILDAYFMLNGVRYQVAGSAGTTLYANKNLPAGPTRCASYHLDQAILYGGKVFPQLETALTKLRTESFKAFFDQISAKVTDLGITVLATN